MRFLQEAIPSSSNVTLSTWDPEFGRKVVRMTISTHCPGSLASSIRHGLKEVHSLTKLDWDLVDKGILM